MNMPGDTDNDRCTLDSRGGPNRPVKMSQLYENMAGEKRVLEAVASGAQLADVLDTIIQVIEDQPGGMICSVLLVDRDGTHLRHGAAPGLPEAYVKAIDGVGIGPSVGSCGTAAYRKELVIVTDVASDPLWAEYRDLALSHGLRACWSTPILASNREVLGTFAMYYREPRSPGQQDLKLLETASRLASIAIERSLRAEELAKLSSAVDQATEAVFITDRRGIVEYVNPAFESRSGYAAADFIGKTPRVLQSGEHTKEFYKELWGTILGGRVFRAEFTNRKKCGEIYYEEKIITPIRDAQGNVTHFVSTGRDISERKRSEAALNREAANTQLLQSAIRAANEAPTLEVALQTVLDMVGDSIGWPVGHAYLIERGSQQEAVSANVWHLAQPDGMQSFIASTTALRFKSGEGLPGRVVATAQPVWIPDLTQCPGCQRAEDAAEAGLRSALAVPIMASSEVVGVLEFFSIEPAAEDVNLLQLATHLGTGLGRVIERARAVEVLSQSEARHRSVVETVRDVIYTLSPEGILLSLNPAFETVTGWPRSEWIGKPFAPIIHPDDLARAIDLFKHTLAGNHPPIVELRVLTRDGGMVVGEFNATPLREDGAVVGVLGVARDVTERKQAEDAIRRLAYYDALTGLPNRASFTDCLTLAVAQARRKRQALTVMFLDVDSFKLVNDTVGHAMGDELLRVAAKRLTGLMREGDTVARVGGDEFTLLLPDGAGVAEATGIAERILEALRRPWQLDGHEFHLTASIGIAIYPDDGTDAIALLRNADTAMYRAKDQGRDNFKLFTEDMNTKIVERVALESDLRRGLERGEFVVYYQPQVKIDSGQVVGVEALVRWQHPERGLVFPMEFIPLAEETGLIQPLGEWVLRAACAQARAWQVAGLPAMRMGVNISSRQFQSPDLPDIVARVLEETGLDAKYLQLEITEGVAMQATEFTVAMLRELKTMGVQISIDDFGTGHSSLAYLKHFPVDAVKIDRSFVRDLTVDPYDAAICETVITLAHSLGLGVVAEGVETKKQLAFLKARKCDEMQGYLFSKAVPPEMLETILVCQKTKSQSKVLPVIPDRLRSRATEGTPAGASSHWLKRVR